jgi:hypothetical protein
MTALRLLPELEDSLRAIPGIRAASVVTSADARPTEVHVLAVPGKTPKQVVRDVQSVAMAQYDLDIDHRIVSVVQIADDVEVAGGPESVAVSAEPATSAGGEDTGPRPALTSITVRRHEGESEVLVALAVGGAVFSGRAIGPALAAHQPRIVAEATLSALTELLGIPALVESAEVVPVGRRDVAVTVLTVTIPRLGEQVLCGSALVRDNVEDAVSRAVLAAVNRRLAG